MSTDPVSTAAVDYLQRVQITPTLSSDDAIMAPPTARRAVRVNGIGQAVSALASPADATLDTGRLSTGTSFEPPTLPLLVGLAGAGAPLAFLLEGQPDGISVGLGTWATDSPDGRITDTRQAMILSILDGCYPAVDVAAAEVGTPGLAYGALALGVPSPAIVDLRDDTLPIDRLVRSMTGLRWAALVLATPVSADPLGAERNLVLSEMRSVSGAVEAVGVRSPLAEHYLSLLQARLDALADAHARGGWRTAVYLLGARYQDLTALAGAWRAVFSGLRSVPEPVRTIAHPAVVDLAAYWALPDGPELPGPNSYRHPYAAQTLLSSAQLAAYVHLPNLETLGFTVSQVPRFDVVAPTVTSADAHLMVGQILNNNQVTAGTYQVPLHSLSRHVFIPGTTGSGKTNTIMGMLLEARAQGVPFLVIEPAKTEYRALIDHPTLGHDVQVFTAGKATVAPFVLNPFEVPAGTMVSEHLDLLRTVFTAAFGMWTPLPQILERCLHDVYLDHGWDLRTNTNARLEGAPVTADAFPTVSDLIDKVTEVIPALGYEERIAGDMRAALLTRLESLRRGAKGAMLDVAQSLPPEELFDRPTVVELEALADEGDKAFFSGLLLIRLVEHRRAQGQSSKLVHLLVVEEAHRLLANVPTRVGEETANPRGQAVETFSNLLSEIRAYGEGVIIADQVPVRLAADVIKNTNLKIAHRIVSADDRAALAGAMAMDEPQAKALTTLAVGEAAVFSGGDDAPLRIRIPLTKDPLSQSPPPDSQVQDHMKRWRDTGSRRELYQPRTYCGQTCARPAACEAAQTLAGGEYAQRTLSRIVTSVIDEPTSFGRLWEDLISVLSAQRPPSVTPDELVRAFAGHGTDWLASRRGTQRSWSYADTSEFRDRLRALLLDKLDTGGDNSATLVSALQQTAHRLYARQFEPYPACHLVCTQDPPLCLYRSAVADLVSSRRHHLAWFEADKRDAGSEDKRRQNAWEVCQDAAYELIDFPTEEVSDEVKTTLDTAARRVCLCFEQQMLADDRRKAPRTVRRILARDLREANL
ncbi:helicase HerA domain-containing protein [Streptomyces nigrescens]|uniref:ATP-binding protein n=1 Tax=Streptomyces nigrescens TaxID=1920 RepID=UPI0034876358